MAEISEDHLLEAVGLSGDRIGQDGVGMTVQGHPPAADRVNQRVAVFPVQQGTVAADDPLLRCSGSQLGEGWPEMGMTFGLTLGRHGPSVLVLSYWIEDRITG